MPSQKHYQMITSAEGIYRQEHLWVYSGRIYVIFSMLMIFQVQATELDFGYYNKYISEGRNQLTTGGIYWLKADHELSDGLSVKFVYGLASESKANYDELNLSLDYASSIEGIDYIVTYTRLEFFEDKASDDEISLGLILTTTEIFSPFTNAVYSRKENGFYLEFGGAKELQVDENILIIPHVLVAYDFGYASAEQDGYNHTSIGATFAYAVSQKITIMGLVEKTFGGSILADEGRQTDQLWSGASIVYSW